jgi:integrase
VVLRVPRKGARLFVIVNIHRPRAGRVGGMRRGELATLDWKNVDLERLCARLDMIKNGERRDVPISPAAVELLKSIPRRLADSAFGCAPAMRLAVLGSGA